MNAIDELLQGAVDYAGLFPPAALPLETVVANYAAYLQHNRRRMLGRLIVPAMRLTDFESALAHLKLSPSSPWRISALVPPVELEAGEQGREAFALAMTRIDEFNQRQDSEGLATVDTIEVKSSSPETTEIIATSLPANLNAFLEIDWRSAPDREIAAIASATSTGNLFAKLRTGGVTADLIPSPEEVARFLGSCATNEVGLKATAGLHHPLRNTFALTYQPDAATATMHGFVNVFVASCLAFTRTITDIDTLSQVLSSDQASDFLFTESHIGYREFRLTAEQVRPLRSNGIVSFGSCSFEEPSQEIGSVFGLASSASP